MKRLLQLREDEVKSIYHDSELVKGLIAMCRNIQEHVTGMFIRCAYKCNLLLHIIYLFK